MKGDFNFESKFKKNFYFNYGNLRVHLPETDFDSMSYLKIITKWHELMTSTGSLKFKKGISLGYYTYVTIFILCSNTRNSKL